MPEQIFDNIFDAFRYIAPSSPLLKLEHDLSRFFRRTNQYELIDMGGYIGAFPGFAIQFFRGESKAYDTCKPSIYRSSDPDDVIVDKLRIIEFKNILLTFPQVQFALADHANVDFLALAQHYELNTNLIDITSAPEIAAYFATRKWVNGVPVPVGEGIGCIRGFMPPYLPPEEQTRDRLYSDKFHMIGLQCFQRPGIQAAYGYELDEGEDFDGTGWKIYFKQNIDASSRIHANFHWDGEKICKNSWLFPEEEIADVAKLIKNSNSISEKSVLDYGTDVTALLERKNIKVRHEPLYELSESRIKELTEEYKDRPYGDVQLTSRLVYIPEG